SLSLEHANSQADWNSSPPLHLQPRSEVEDVVGATCCVVPIKDLVEESGQ
ncbi:hypothetical protein A2U01_0004423, partial [Trifolium medium]|nr:hypothetical protein [Trifolium medium]